MPALSAFSLFLARLHAVSKSQFQRVLLDIGVIGAVQPPGLQAVMKVYESRDCPGNVHYRRFVEDVEHRTLQLDMEAALGHGVIAPALQTVA